jgi:hypothetical protein
MLIAPALSAVKLTDRKAALVEATGIDSLCFKHGRGAAFTDTCDVNRTTYLVYKGDNRQCPAYGEPVGSVPGWTVCKGN